MRLALPLALLAVLGACDSSPPPALPGPAATTTTVPAAREPAAPPASTGPAHWVAPGGECSPARHPQPGGPFVALIECRPESGATLGVALADGEPDVRLTAAWPPSARTWQDGAWTRDVTSLAWAPDGGRLFVASADIVGAGGLWELDLVSRQARQLLPAGDAVTPEIPGPGYVILGIDPERQTLRYTVAPWSADDRGATLSFRR
jgi:hypothetical protein